MRIIYTCFLLLLVQFSFGQFGVRTKYNFNNFGDLNNLHNDGSSTEIWETSPEIGIDYWFRLKNQRVEFYPELNFTRAESNISHPVLSDIKMTGIGFQVNVNLYLLDFAGDCDCPTFSKQGNFFTKGFHFILSPGVQYLNFAADNDIYNDSAISLFGAIGAGMDIGVTDMLTITPFSQYKLSSGIKWSNLNDLASPSVADGFNISQIIVGLRIGMRLDYDAPRF